jgi:hypothetical protein
MAYRMFNHTSLAAHFLLLAAIYICITKNDKERSILRNCVIWSTLVAVCAGTHIYLLAMVFALMCFYIIDNIFEHKRIKRTIIEVSVPILTVLLVFFLLGVFHSDAEYIDQGFGASSTNLNQFINPNAVYADINTEYSDYSVFIRAFPLLPRSYGSPTSSRQSEGSSYIGLGMIIMFFVALFALIDDFKEYRSKLSDKNVLRRVIIAVIAFFAFYVFALSPVVTFNENIIINYSRIVPDTILHLWAILRGTGRFVWVCVYILMIVIIWIVARKFKRHTLIVMAVILVFVQSVDISGYFVSKGRFFKEEHVYEVELKSDIWDIIARDYKHIVYVNNAHRMYEVLIFASYNGLTMNDTYLARQNVSDVEAHKATTWEMLNNGIADPDTVYVFYGIPEHLIVDNTLVVYIVDDMIIGVAQEIENAEQLRGVERVVLSAEPSL